MSLKHGIMLALVAGIVFPAIGQQLAPSRSDPAAQRAPADPANGPVAPGSDASRQTAIRPPAVPADVPRAQRNGIDETALRYFAAQGDTRRLEAEIARLRALYPSWTPPDELSEATGDPELERMWKLYADGKYAEVRGAIAGRLAEDPSWVPPDDLLQRLDEAEARRRLVNAADAGQWNSVISIATEAPTLLTCESVDMLWRVAEAFAKTSRPDRALGAYTYVLTNCEDPPARLATLQKAMTVLPDQEIDQLMKYERNGEFDPIRDDLARRRVNAAALDTEKTASKDDLDRLDRLARNDTTNVEDALSLGWYDFHHAMRPAALEWFKLAMDRNGGPKAAEGLVYTLSSLDRLLEAEPIAYQWRDATPDNLKAYLDLMVTIFSQDPPLKLDPSVLARFTPVLEQTKYALGAQAVGWYAYNTSQLSTAARWFQTTLRWQDDMEPAAYGLALCGLRIPNREIFNDIVAVWRDRSARIYELTLPPNRRRPQPPQLTPLVGDLSRPVTILPSPVANQRYSPAYSAAASTMPAYGSPRGPAQAPMATDPYASPYGAPPADPYAMPGGTPYASAPALSPYGVVDPAQQPYRVPQQYVQSQPRPRAVVGSPTFSGGMMPAGGSPTPGGGGGSVVPPGAFVRPMPGAQQGSGSYALGPSAPPAYYDPAQSGYPAGSAGYQQPATGYSYSPALTGDSGYPSIPAQPSAEPSHQRGSSNGHPVGAPAAGMANAYAYVVGQTAPAMRIVYPPDGPASPTLGNGTQTPASYRPPPSTATAYLPSAHRAPFEASNAYTADFQGTPAPVRMAQAVAPPAAVPLPSPMPPPAAGSPAAPTRSSGQVLSAPSVTTNTTMISGGRSTGGAYASPSTYRSPSASAGVDYYGIANGPTVAPRARTARTGRSGGSSAVSPATGCQGSTRSSGTGALARAWCLMDLDRPIEATKAFDQAIATSTGRTREEAAYGKSLAYLRKGLTDQAALAAAESPQSVRRSVELGAQILTQRALSFYEDKRYVETIVALDERARIVPEQVDLMLIRGYAYFEMGRYDDAEQLFRAVERTGVSREAGRGLMAILSRTRQLPGE